MKTAYPDTNNYQLQITFNSHLGTLAHQSMMEVDAKGCHALSVKVQNNQPVGVDLQYFPH